MILRPGRLIFIFLLILTAAVYPEAARAQRVELISKGEPPWRLEADRISGDRKKNVYLAEGRVKITKGKETIEADRVRFHYKTQTGEAQGRVVITAPDLKVVCKRFLFNLEHNIGKFYEGKAYFPEGHYYLKGDEIEKTGPESFYIIKGQITSCDGPNPAWTLTGRNIRVRKEGYATVNHATLSTRYFSVLYTPWMKVPVKSKRQSGLLAPEFQISELDGFTYAQPFFWAISDSHDMTVYLTHMAFRGLETCLEYRYKDWGGKGIYRAAYLQDREPPTIAYPSPAGLTVQEDRYWLRGMSNLATESGFQVKLDLDYVSDPDYLAQFEDGLTGYQRTQRQFFKEFGRELAEPLDPFRKNTLLVSKTMDNQTIDFALKYTDNLNDPENRDTLQRLPQIDLALTRTKVAGTPFYFQNMASYNYFTRRRNEGGHRLDIHPRLYWPIKYAGWLDLEPSMGFRETIYQPFGTADPDREGRFDTRGLNDFEMTASAGISRIFDLGPGGVEKVRHRIKPVIGFSAVSHLFQGDLPYFDGIDRIKEKQQIRYGLVNYLVAKAREKKAGPDEKAQPKYTYHDFLRLGIFRIYDLVEARRDLETRPPEQPEDFRRPNLPWEIELEMKIKPYFRFKANSKFDTYDERFTGHSLELNLKDGRGDYIFVGYELNLEPYIYDNREEYEYEQVSCRLNLELAEEWSIQMQKKYSIMDEENIESVYSINYHPQCWSLRLEYMEKPDDRSMALIWSLVGIGDIGTIGYTPEAPDI